ncbi:hypothetical protein [Brochothrix campestris]|uniref:Uncharacterized protein n=1 Tax=Brochothrix campestris FSL F6-1037 TaxID=1265861 RepID=W7CGM6_9LIST|nr:hypothetical protein [Brochothrix campestris]EUJ34986.1 hypothetical protein BCAMP_12060 [Brochothrix campestris FSL F6-1037]
MKFKAALNYQFSYQIRAFLIYSAIYITSAIIFPLIGLYFSNTTEVIKSDVLISPLVFMVILMAVGSKIAFNLFVQNSTSRQTIFLSLLVSNGVIAIMTTVLNMLLITITNHFSNGSLQLYNFIGKIYRNDPFFGIVATCFFVFFSAGLLGMLITTFSQRFLTTTKLLVSAGIVFLGIILSIVYQFCNEQLQQSFQTFVPRLFGFTGNQPQVSSFMLTVVIVIILEAVFLYLMNRHREIKTKTA